MKGLVFPGNRKVQFLDFADPAPGPGEVVLEIKASGMCGTDLKYYRGSPESARAYGFSPADNPVIAGHEPCGVVVAKGAGVSDTIRIGERVMQHHYKGCAHCSFCASGWTQMCAHGMQALYGVTGHGAHARYMLCPASSVVAMPDEVSFVAGAAISCGTGTAWSALQRLQIQGHHTIAVFGQGPVGQSATLLAAALGSRVIAIDVQKSRLEKAMTLGADATVLAGSDEEVLPAILALTDGRGVELALDTSAHSGAQAQAVRCVQPWGKVCFVGEGGSVSLDVSKDLLRRQVTLMGSWTFSMAGQRQCAEFVARKNVPIEDLFSHRWRLSDGEEAYRVFDTQTSGKAVLIPD